MAALIRPKDFFFRFLGFTFKETNVYARHIFFVSRKEHFNDFVHVVFVSPRTPYAMKKQAN